LVDRKFGTTLDRSTISKILKSKCKIINNANRLSVKRAIIYLSICLSRVITFPEVDVEPFNGCIQNQMSMPISEAILMEQSMYIACKMKEILEKEQITRGWNTSLKNGMI